MAILRQQRLPYWYRDAKKTGYSDNEARHA
jgi:hypothetical protein